MELAGCKLKPTKHATNAMIERGISKFEALEVISKGAKKAQGRKIITLLRKIELVYLKFPCQYIVITAYREVRK